MTDLIGAIKSEPVSSASRDADSLAALAALGKPEGALQDPSAVSFSAQAIEIAALRLALSEDADATEACREAFELLRAVLQDAQLRSQLPALEIVRIRTRAAAFGVLGGMHAQTRQLLEEVPDTTIESSGWGTSTELTMLEVWQLLIRKRGWGI